MCLFFPQDFISTINCFWFWDEYFVKSGKIIFNLNESFSEYKNNENNFQYLCEKPISTYENEEDADPFKKEFSNNLLLENENIFQENEKNILQENEKNILQENDENVLQDEFKEELTDEENSHDLIDNGKISCH